MENTHNKTMLTPHQQIVSHNYSYPDQGPKPCAHFWKQLTLHSPHTPSLLIPDTLVINLKEQPLLWVYTNGHGKIESNSNISLKDYVGKVTSFCSPNELVACQKRLVNKSEQNNHGNDLKLVNSRYLHNLTLQQFGDNIVTLQKYIKSHGKHAFICRTVYTNQTHSHCFLITNRVGYFQEVPEHMRFLVTDALKTRYAGKYTITRSATGRHLAETLPILKEIVNYMRFQRGVTLQELVADFIKDQQGNWWLTNVKAFRVVEKMKKNLLVASRSLQRFNPLGEKEKYQRTKQCRYCQISYLQSQLTHKLTRQMLIQMDRYLLHLGKTYQWLSRSDSQTDSHTLYQEQTVCSRCYRLYLQIQALLHFQLTFLKKLNLSCESNPKDLLMRLTSKQQLQAQAKDKEIMNLKTTIPPEISLGPNSSIITKDNRPLRNDQTIHQMSRYRFLLYLHELDQLIGITPYTSYHLQFTLFNNKFKTKLDTLHPGMTSTVIKKLRVCYFFLPVQTEQECFNEYVNKQENLKIYLIAENRQSGEKRSVGCLTLGLREFLLSGRKNFYKFFDTEYGFGWGLEGSIGVVRTQKEVNTSRLILTTEDRLVYLPNQHYFICEPLPQDWIVQLETKNKGKPLDITIKSNDCMKFLVETGDQFIPDKTFVKKTDKKEKKIDWGTELKKQLKSYERQAFKVIQRA